MSWIYWRSQSVLLVEIQIQSHVWSSKFLLVVTEFLPAGVVKLIGNDVGAELRTLDEMHGYRAFTSCGFTRSQMV
jgi:hypothetical protein